MNLKRGIGRLLAPLYCLSFLHPSSSWATGYTTRADRLCYGYPEVTSLHSADRCVGLVADTKTIPWNKPRKVLIDNNLLYVSTMGGWERGRGQLWRMDLANKSWVKLYEGLDRSHGLRKGPDGMIYIGDATRILKFDPKKPAQLINVISNLPDSYLQANATSLDSNHPLTEFLFLDNGDMVVNIGAPSNDCTEEFQEIGICKQRESQAELRLYKYNQNTSDFNANYFVVARGLRNSLGLIYNSKTNTLFQAENSMDLQGTYDEINKIDLNQWLQSGAADYGWPYCSEGKTVLQSYAYLADYCQKETQAPLVLIPPHAAPLDMQYYAGQLFSEIQGSVIMSWHGHRPSGSKIVAYKTDSQGDIINAEPMILLQNWAEIEGQHPKGRPAGITTDVGGAIYIVDDVNNSLLVLAKSNLNTEVKQNRDSDFKLVVSDSQKAQWDHLFPRLIKPLNCASCHSDVITADSQSTLVNLFKNSWLKKGVRYQDQKLWLRMTQDKQARIMPPQPAENLNDRKYRKARSQLKNWIKALQ